MAAPSPHFEPGLTSSQDLRLELARRHMSDFVQYTKPNYKPSAWSEQVCGRLDKFLADCFDRKSPRLMLFAPPRHGKTELATRRLPAFALGQWTERVIAGEPAPDLGEIISTSYAHPLAERFNRDVQRIMDDTRYLEVFPDAQIPSRNVRTDSRGKLRNAETFELVNYDGSYRCAGVGSGIGGMGATLYFNIDDPVKDAAEANSLTKRDGVWEWYVSTALLRLEEGAGLLLIMTRWNHDDLAGRLQEKMREGTGETFEVMSCQALAEKDEPGRKEGEALVPHRFSAKTLHRIQKAVGSYVWSALYQQDPSVKGGDVFLGEWWQFYKVVPKLLYIRLFADTASKTKERNDYSVFQAWGMGTDGRIYLLGQIRGKWKSPELRRNAVAFWVKWSQPRRDSVVCRSFGIEDASSGIGLIQDLSVAKHEGKRIAIPVVAIPRNVDKSVRADDGSPQIQAGNVWLPDPEISASCFAGEGALLDYLMEFEAFTKEGSHPHDDQIDPTLDAIAEMLGGVGNLYDGAIGPGLKAGP